MLIDTHAHLYLDQFAKDIDQVIQRAKDNNVDKIFLPNIDSSTIPALHKLADSYPDTCYPMMGLHPCSVGQKYELELEILKSKLATRKYYAIGETGVDLYWDKSFRKEQVHAFEYQIDLAKEYDLAVVIHSRDSLDLTIDLISGKHEEGLQGIFHCFNGDIDQCRRIIDLGFMMGLGGVITFKNAAMDEVLKYIPLQNVVLETDAPYLSPEPYRGKRNESSYLIHILEKLATIKFMTTEEVERITTHNAKLVFGLQ